MNCKFCVFVECSGKVFSQPCVVVTVQFWCEHYHRGSYFVLAEGPENSRSAHARGDCPVMKACIHRIVKSLHSQKISCSCCIVSSPAIRAFAELLYAVAVSICMRIDWNSLWQSTCCCAWQFETDLHDVDWIIIDVFLFRMLPAAADVGSWWTSFCMASAAANSEVCIVVTGHMWVLALESWHRWCTVPSLWSHLVGQEKIRSSSWSHPWMIAISALTLLVQFVWVTGRILTLTIPVIPEVLFVGVPVSSRNNCHDESC